jgi:hypothetical protein
MSDSGHFSGASSAKGKSGMYGQEFCSYNLQFRGSNFDFWKQG